MKLFKLQDHFGELITYYTETKSLESILKKHIEKELVFDVSIKEYIDVNVIDCDLSLSEEDLLDLIFNNYELYDIDEFDLQRNFTGLRSLKLLNVTYKYNPRFTTKVEPNEIYTEHLMLFEYDLEK